MNTMLCALLSTVIENKPWPLCREGKKDRLESAGPQNQLILPLPFLLEEIGTWEEEMTFPNCDCHVSRAPIQNPCARPIVPRVGSNWELGRNADLGVSFPSLPPRRPGVSYHFSVVGSCRRSQTWVRQSESGRSFPQAAMGECKLMWVCKTRLWRQPCSTSN